MNDEAWEFLNAESSRHINIEVKVELAGGAAEAVDPVYSLKPDTAVDPLVSAPVEVCSRHTTDRGGTLGSFQITWSHGSALTTEYNAGMSAFHDIKDHTLYGLGVTPFTEIQTLVQTVYGRAMADAGRPPSADSWQPVLFAAIHDELFGPRGPRVYDPRAKGLLENYAPNATPDRKKAALTALWFTAAHIMLPPLAKMYEEHVPALLLQRSLRQQAPLVRAMLPQVKWTNQRLLLLRLNENIGLQMALRARVDPELSHISHLIESELRDYVEGNRLDKEFGAIFSVEGYTVY